MAVAVSITAIYLREDPAVEYINCGFCTYYRATDKTFLAFHMLERHKQELLNASVVSHNSISPGYNLEARAIFIAELVKESSYMPAGWLATRRSSNKITVALDK